MKELLTISEAANKMRVSRETIYAWIRKGKILPVQTPSGRLRIDEAQLIISIPQNEGNNLYAHTDNK